MECSSSTLSAKKLFYKNCTDAQQDSDFVTVHIDAPYVKFADGEMCISGNEFSFYCKPYHLKLYFSGELIENDTESAKYSVEKGQFTINLPKYTKGEEFANLDMLTKLMTPSHHPKTVKASALIEVLDDGSQKDVDEYDDIDWSVEQVFPGLECLSIETPHYGFNRKATGVFKKRIEEQHEILDIEYPDSTLESDRRQLQLDHEKQHFNFDHYIADLMDDGAIQEIILYTSCIEENYCKISNGNQSTDETVVYSKEEVESLVRLPKKEYLLDENQQKAALLGLVDILYACLYDLRTTMEECTVESAWTIRKMSGTLSWLVSSRDVRSVVHSAVRRTLCFPLYRHWNLAKKVLNDVYITLASGKKQILKCLLYVQNQFSNTESYHILNDLYITDYCVWIQTVSDKNISSLAQLVKEISISKEDIDLDIPVLEAEYLSGLSNISEDTESEIDSDHRKSANSESDDSESDGSESDDSESDGSESDDSKSDDNRSKLDGSGLRAISQTSVKNENLCISAIEERLADLSVENTSKVNTGMKNALIEVICSCSSDEKD